MNERMGSAMKKMDPAFKLPGVPKARNWALVYSLKNQIIFSLRGGGKDELLTSPGSR